MSFVFAVPEMVAATASDLASLGAALSEATAAAAIPTTQVLAAAADEVSAAIAELFGAHGQEFQALSAQASAFHDRFVRALAPQRAGMSTPRPPTPRWWTPRPPARRSWGQVGARR